MKKLNPYQETRLAEMLGQYAEWLETNYPQETTYEPDNHQQYSDGRLQSTSPDPLPLPSGSGFEPGRRQGAGNADDRWPYVGREVDTRLTTTQHPAQQSFGEVYPMTQETVKIS